MHMQAQIKDSDALWQAMKFCNSAERPWKFIELSWMDFEKNLDPAISADYFWEAVAEIWSGFDAIPHDEYESLFDYYGDEWSPDCMSAENRSFYEKLPKRVHLIRGYDADIGSPEGLSWTVDRAVAEDFAHGHRGHKAKNPTLAFETVHKHEIAFVSTEREESEIVLFCSPREKELSKIALEPKLRKST